MDIKKEEEILRESYGFKELNKQELANLSKDELASYYRFKRLYEYASCSSLKKRKLKELMYPLVRKLLILNRTLIDKQNVKILSDEQVISDKPVIYAITHIGKFDYQIITEVLGEHTYAFAGDPEEMYRTFDGFFMETNGVIYCDTENKMDRYIAENTAVELLKRGTSLVIYPEGIWNLSSNLLMLPIFPGVIRIAQKACVDIVPVAIEQYDNNFYIRIEKNIKIDNHDINDLDYINKKKDELRNVMAFSKLDIIKSMPVVKRDSLEIYESENIKFKFNRLNEWVDKDKKPFYTLDKVKSRTFKPKDDNGIFIDSPSEVFSYYKKLKINKNNLFLLRRDLSLPNDIQEEVKRI